MIHIFTEKEIDEKFRKQLKNKFNNDDKIENRYYINVVEAVNELLTVINSFITDDSLLRAKEIERDLNIDSLTLIILKTESIYELFISAMGVCSTFPILESNNLLEVNKYISKINFNIGSVNLLKPHTYYKILYKDND